MLVIAAKRPPVEETASFLQSLLASHGPNYLEKLFGSKARDALAPLGGVNMVAIALSGELSLIDELLINSCGLGRKAPQSHYHILIDNPSELPLKRFSDELILPQYYFIRSKSLK